MTRCSRPPSALSHHQLNVVTGAVAVVDPDKLHHRLPHLLTSIAPALQESMAVPLVLVEAVMRHPSQAPQVPSAVLTATAPKQYLRLVLPLHHHIPPVGQSSRPAAVNPLSFQERQSQVAATVASTQ